MRNLDRRTHQPGTELAHEVFPNGREGSRPARPGRPRPHHRSCLERPPLGFRRPMCGLNQPSLRRCTGSCQAGDVNRVSVLVTEVKVFRPGSNAEEYMVAPRDPTTYLPTVGAWVLCGHIPARPSGFRRPANHVRTPAAGWIGYGRFPFPTLYALDAIAERRANRPDGRSQRQNLQQACVGWNWRVTAMGNIRVSPKGGCNGPRLCAARCRGAGTA